VNEWLSERADRLAAAAQVDRTQLSLSTPEVEQLLEIARVAAHESGDRRNAPLLCYLVGVARATGRSVEELGREAR